MNSGLLLRMDATRFLSVAGLCRAKTASSWSSCTTASTVPCRQGAVARGVGRCQLLLTPLMLAAAPQTRWRSKPSIPPAITGLGWGKASPGAAAATPPSPPPPHFPAAQQQRTNWHRDGHDHSQPPPPPIPSTLTHAVARHRLQHLSDLQPQRLSAALRLPRLPPNGHEVLQQRLHGPRRMAPSPQVPPPLPWPLLLPAPCSRHGDGGGGGLLPGHGAAG